MSSSSYPSMDHSEYIAEYKLRYPLTKLSETTNSRDIPKAFFNWHIIRTKEYYAYWNHILPTKTRLHSMRFNFDRYTVQQIVDAIHTFKEIENELFKHGDMLSYFDVKLMRQMKRHIGELEPEFVDDECMDELEEDE